jgi:cysteine-rich repeat protein
VGAVVVIGLLLLASIPAGAQTCGNSMVEAGEQCDDGAANGTAGSCCLATCQFESLGTACTDTTPADCFDAICNGAGSCAQNPSR